MGTLDPLDDAFTPPRPPRAHGAQAPSALSRILLEVERAAPAMALEEKLRIRRKEQMRRARQRHMQKETEEKRAERLRKGRERAARLYAQRKGK